MFLRDGSRVNYAEDSKLDKMSTQRAARRAQEAITIRGCTYSLWS
jgi:hypothetical protein